MFVIKHFPTDVLVIDSNLEEVRKLTGSYPGFINDFSFFAGLVLLADYLGIGYLSTGMMLESTYIRKGYHYIDFHNSTYFKKWFKFFNRANLPLFFPCIPCSEILTNKIVNDNHIVAQSCIRGTEGNGCGTCYKCFRKKLLGGNLLDNYASYPEIQSTLVKRPLKQGASLICAMNRGNFDIPELKEYKKLDLDWLDDYFDYTLLALPEEYRGYLRNEISKYAILNTDETKLKTFKL